MRLALSGTAVAFVDTANRAILSVRDIESLAAGKGDPIVMADIIVRQERNGHGSAGGERQQEKTRLN